MANMIPISTVTVGSGGASTIEFNNIPQTYTDLKVVVSTRSSASGADPSSNPWIYFNGSTSNQTAKGLYSATTSTGSFTDTKIYATSNSNSGTSNTFGNAEFYIPNYTSLNNKTISSDSVMENNSSASNTYLLTGLWSNTSTITSITIKPFDSSNWLQYSSATLYGIRKY